MSGKVSNINERFVNSCRVTSKISKDYWESGNEAGLDYPYLI